MTRHVLPQRRKSQTFRTTHGGQNAEYVVTLGFYEDGVIGEVFVSGALSGSMMESLTRTGAVLISLCLQHHVPIETIRGAVMRDLDGTASDVIGHVVDIIAKNSRHPE